jgi:hypothetical protein
MTAFWNKVSDYNIHGFKKRKKYRKSRGATGVAKERRLASSLASGPSEGVEFRQAVALGNKLLNGGKPFALQLKPWDIHNKDLVMRNSRALCRLEGRLQKRNACDQGLCSGRLELMLKFLGRVDRVGGSNDSGESMSSIRDGDVVNL